MNAPALPGVLAEIAAACGRKVALRLALTLGGENLYVPRPENLGPDHALVAAVGLAAARDIAAKLTGCSIYVPRARRALVGYLTDTGRSTREIADRLGISRSAVRQYQRQGNMLP